MHSIAIGRSTSWRCDWKRTTSLAGALAVHVFALLVLALPVAVPTAPPAPVDIGVILIDPPAEPVAIPLPPEPQPPARTPPRQVTVQPQVVPPSTVPQPSTAVLAIPASDGPAQVPTIATGEQATPGIDASLDYAHIVNPPYPRDALRRGEHGTVLLRVLVGIDGLPKQVTIARSSGSPRLDRAALDAVQQWRFRPVQVNGVAVPASGLVPVAFNLDRA